MVSNLGASISQADETPKQRNPCQEKSSTILLDSRALSIFVSIGIVMIGSNHLFPPPLFQQVGYSSAQPCHKRRPHPQRPRTSEAVVGRANLHRSLFHSDKLTKNTIQFQISSLFGLKIFPKWHSENWRKFRDAPRNRDALVDFSRCLRPVDVEMFPPWM